MWGVSGGLPRDDRTQVYVMGELTGQYERIVRTVHRADQVHEDQHQWSHRADEHGT
jgi:hypothetical protein